MSPDDRRALLRGMAALVEEAETLRPARGGRAARPARTSRARNPGEAGEAEAP
jgi:hypothetical protein